MPGKIRQYFKDKKDDVQDYAGGSGVIGKLILALVVVYLLVALVLGMFWSSEPETFSVREHTRSVANSMEREPITGFATTVTMIRIGETLLDKPGGYISNDVFPPGLWLDNMPNWEYGVLVQLRDLSRAMRKDISRSQSQSAEDQDLVIAEPQFHFDSGSWAMRPTSRPTPHSRPWPSIVRPPEQPGKIRIRIGHSTQLLKLAASRQAVRQAEPQRFVPGRHGLSLTCSIGQPRRRDIRALHQQVTRGIQHRQSIQI